MLIYSMGLSADGYVKDRDGEFDWGAPAPEQFRVHLEQVQGLGAHLLGRRLYETMQVWETDPSLRVNELDRAFAEAWTALPKVVFSRTLDRVDGSNVRLATRPLAEEVAATLAGTDRDVAIGGADLAGQAVEIGLVDELWMFRSPLVVGGGTPFLPPVDRAVQLELLEVRTFASRVVLERYRRVPAT